MLCQLSGDYVFFQLLLFVAVCDLPNLDYPCNRTIDFLSEHIIDSHSLAPSLTYIQRSTIGNAR